ncbi:DUF4905 domain-containing protein [Inquilinus sp. KBS0705]|nr:DUF4905 domain-containing protein [Inquilinus sp. KBS0705]
MTLLQPFIAQTFANTIWRLEIDALTGIMVLELRNQPEKQVSFATISLKSADVYIQNYTTPERWLTGVEAIYNGVMLLHHYKTESGPEHKAIVAVDAVTATQFWSNYSLAFDHMSVNGPVVYNTTMLPKKLVLADIRTGEVKRPYDSVADKPLPNNIVVPEMVAANQLPAASLPTDAYGNIVHYLNHNKYIIVSLHTFKNGLLQQHLFIMDDTGIVYQNLINQDIQKLQPEAFVLHKNALIYIKNKVELKVLNL